MKDDAKKWAVVWIIIGVESGVGVLLQVRNDCFLLFSLRYSKYRDTQNELIRKGFIPYFVLGTYIYSKMTISAWLLACYNFYHSFPKVAVSDEDPWDPIACIAIVLNRSGLSCNIVIIESVFGEGNLWVPDETFQDPNGNQFAKILLSGVKLYSISYRWLFDVFFRTGCSRDRVRPWLVD